MKLHLILHILGDDLQVKLLGKPFIEILENNEANVADCTAQTHVGAKVMSSEISGAATFMKKQLPLAEYTHC